VLTITPACAQAGRQSYFPLAVGAKWEYTGRYSSADGHQFAGRAEIRVDGETLIHGRRYFKYVITSDLSGVLGAPKTQEYVRYYRAAPDGLYFLTDKNIDAPERLELPIPMQVDVKWLNGAAEGRAERAGTIKVGGREYADCVKVTYTEPGGIHTTENYLAPGVGVVKSVYVNNTAPKSTIELTLEKYHL
jgi:hypothetical protein